MPGLCRRERCPLSRAVTVGGVVAGVVARLERPPLPPGGGRRQQAGGQLAVGQTRHRVDRDPARGAHVLGQTLAHQTLELALVESVDETCRPDRPGWPARLARLLPSRFARRRGTAGAQCPARAVFRRRQRVVRHESRPARRTAAGRELVGIGAASGGGVRAVVGIRPHARDERAALLGRQRRDACPELIRRVAPVTFVASVASAPHDRRSAHGRTEITTMRRAHRASFVSSGMSSSSMVERVKRPK